MMNGIIIGILLALALVPAAYAELEIPDWVRTVAGFWSQGQISDEEFVRAMQYLAYSGSILPAEDTRIDGQLPFTIGTEFTVQNCEIVIEGITNNMIDARTIPPETACDLRVYEEAYKAMVGGIKVTYSDGTHDIVYAPWVPFEGDVSEWSFEPGSADGLVIVFHDITGAYADDFGTIFFDAGGVYSVYIGTAILPGA